MKILISNNPETLREELQKYFHTATVEAEYGEKIVEGSWRTLAHHGLSEEESIMKCPSRAGTFYTTPNGLVTGVSHFDLDTLLGVYQLHGGSIDPLFGKAAAWVDVKGPHRLNEFFAAIKTPIHLSAGQVAGAKRYEREIRERLCAFWAWSQENRLFAPRDGSVADCTEFFQDAIQVLEQIGKLDPALIEKGRAWAKAQADLNEKSFVREEHSVILRRANQFVNHLYNTPDDGVTRSIVIAFNEKFKSVTISTERPIPGFSCRELVQSLWGLEAGGHNGIAGSPRGKEMNFADAEMAYAEFMNRIITFLRSQR